MEATLSKQNRIYLLILVICAICFSTILLPDESFLYLTDEDGPFECAGAMFFIFTSILIFTLFFGKNRFQNEQDALYFSTKSKRIWFLLLGILFFFLFGEEISWGQRIFGWAGFDSNVQGETNFHNWWIFNYHISEPGAKDEVVKTGLAAWLTAKKIFVYIFLSFLFLLPLGVKLVPFIQKLTKRFHLPIPAIELGILFILNILMYKALKPLTDFDGAGRGLAEIEEFNFALILFLIPFVWLRNQKGSFKPEA